MKHQVEVSVDSLLEAAALGLAAMEHEAWDGTGPGATLEIRVVPPVVTHSVSVQRVLRWLDGVTTSPKEKSEKERLKVLPGR